MQALILGLAALLGAARPEPVVPIAASDSLILREIADSLKVGVRSNITRMEGGRVVYLSIYYQGQKGDIPPALGGLDSLRHLHMAITGVTSLPKEIGRLKRMDTIDIGSSRIGPTIPDEIGELSNLRCLKVTGCRLTTLPASLMKLQKLETVSFVYNQICSMDDSLQRWLLAKWPAALDIQDRSNCAPTGLLPATPRPGTDRTRRLYVPGLPVPERMGGPEERRIYYSPLGRLAEVPEGNTLGERIQGR